MKITPEIAEFYGALLGDGCLSKYKTGKRLRHCTQFTGHSHDRQYYENVLRPTLQANFGINGSISPRKGTNAIIYNILCKRTFDFFHIIGMPIGKKHDLQMPPEICQNLTLARACIRGIFNTDGSIYRRYQKKYNRHPRIYPHLVIQIKMNAYSLLEQIEEILDGKGILTNRITRDKNSFVFRITDQDSVTQFMEFIDTKHEYHRERYLNSCQGIRT